MGLSVRTNVVVNSFFLTIALFYLSYLLSIWAVGSIDQKTPTRMHAHRISGSATLNEQSPVHLMLSLYAVITAGLDTV